MQRLATAAVLVLALGLLGCPDGTPTGTMARASDVFERLRREVDAQDLRLHPSGFGKHSYASWKAEEGRQDSQGEADNALYLQKMTPTPTVAAGIAVIDGVAGIPASSITGLSWEHREDGHCGAGAPRWNVNLISPEGRRFTVFLGCLAAVHTPAGTDDQGRRWIRDSYPGTGAGSIEQEILAQTGQPASGLMVRSLVIVFDEGNDHGPGYVHLDNITVAINGEPKIFTGPMDNGR